MNRPTALSRISSAVGDAGEWAHYSAAMWVSFASGGLDLTGIYLIAVTIPGVVYRTGRSAPRFVRRLGGLVSPAGLIVLWGLSSDGLTHPLYLVATGLSIGAGAALAGRPVAFTSTLNAGPGAAAVAGALAVVVFAAQGEISNALALAAALLFLSALISENQTSEVRVAPPAFVRGAQLALAITVGMRIVEPVVIVESSRVFDPEPVSSALFAAVWAIGAAVGWRAAPQLDARIVLSAPFIAAGALAAMGALSGPAMVSLWGVVGSCAGTLGGSGMAKPSDSLWPKGRRILLPAAFLGALSMAWWLRSESGFEVATGSAAALLIASGFIGLAAARRVPIPQLANTASPARRVPISVRVVSEPESKAVEARLGAASETGAATDLLSAVAELRSALVRARSIRREALAIYASSTPVIKAPDSTRTLEVADLVLADARRIGERVRRLAAALENQPA